MQLWQAVQHLDAPVGISVRGGDVVDGDKISIISKYDKRIYSDFSNSYPHRKFMNMISSHGLLSGNNKLL